MICDLLVCVANKAVVQTLGLEEASFPGLQLSSHLRGQVDGCAVNKAHSHDDEDLRILWGLTLGILLDLVGMAGCVRERPMAFRFERAHWLVNKSALAFVGARNSRAAHFAIKAAFVLFCACVVGAVLNSR
jgi:hypothetical protein